METINLSMTKDEVIKYIQDVCGMKVDSNDLEISAISIVEMFNNPMLLPTEKAKIAERIYKSYSVYRQQGLRVVLTITVDVEQTDTCKVTYINETTREIVRRFYWSYEVNYLDIDDKTLDIINDSRGVVFNSINRNNLNKRVGCEFESHTTWKYIDGDTTPKNTVILNKDDDDE